MFLGLFVLWYVDGRLKREMVVHGFIAFWLAWVLAHGLKLIFPTVRPFLINGEQSLVVFPEANGAFPSGHSAAVFALASIIWFHNKKLGLLYFLGALGVGVGRVLANVHYPVDVFGGAFLGSLVAIFIEKWHFFKLHILKRNT